ncbi:hypothetical protein ACKFKF_29690 [Phormidesmis sp. 146-12]
MELTSNRSKGLNAYLAPIKPDGKADLTLAMYGTPKTDADEDKAHRSKRHTVVIDEATLADGYYQYKEAGGADFNKARYGWLEIKSGKIISEFDKAEFEIAFLIH